MSYTWKIWLIVQMYWIEKKAHYNYSIAILLMNQALHKHVELSCNPNLEA